MERWLRLRLGEQLDLLEITQGVDLAGWARQREALGVERILVFGGDGTFRAVADAMEGMELPLALVATGTNNNISRALGLPNLIPDTPVELSPQVIGTGGEREGEVHLVLHRRRGERQSLRAAQFHDPGTEASRLADQVLDQHLGQWS